MFVIEEPLRKLQTLSEGLSCVIYLSVFTVPLPLASLIYIETTKYLLP